MKTQNEKADSAKGSDLKELLSDKTYLNIPKEGDVVRGEVISITKNEVQVDIPGYRPGIIRGRELSDPIADHEELQVGDEVEATVIDLENENGEVELSFRYAGQRKAWDRMHELFRSGEPLTVKVIEASKGGLIVKVFHLTAFLPVSQLSPENYPRVAGGDKTKILEKLKSFVNGTMDVRIIDVSERDEKVIVSEKAVWEDRQKNIISRYQIGQVVTGEVSALADFGAFIKFDILEGLVHISEIAWQRIDHPRDLLKVGDQVKAEIIGIEGSKIFLSMKKLIDDPWKDVAKKYQVGQKVKGLILKANPFGFFVELDPDIHGLAHISELSRKPVKDVTEIGKPGETIEFMVVSVEPEQHRLGLSLKALEEGMPKDRDRKDDGKGKKKAERDESKKDGESEEENGEEKKDKE
ncbi:S1 RNA-binding domain-containing protein [Candidatus Uhrbacteria bacterium]|nr:S1 RNA-binding domain-containing protein [Candidatus Uhrbacteria bacterium]